MCFLALQVLLACVQHAGTSHYLDHMESRFPPPHRPVLFLYIYFNLILQSTGRSYKEPFPFRSSKQSPSGNPKVLFSSGNTKGLFPSNQPNSHFSSGQTKSVFTSGHLNRLFPSSHPKSPFLQLIQRIRSLQVIQSVPYLQVIQTVPSFSSSKGSASFRLFKQSSPLKSSTYYLCFGSSKCPFLSGSFFYQQRTPISFST